MSTVEHDPLAKSPVVQVPVSGPLADVGHGTVEIELTEHPLPLKQHAPERKATGLAAVLSTFRYGIGEAGLLRGTLPLLQINQKDGFDCPGCAWPDHDGRRVSFDFCENGAKAMAHESDKRRITREFFATHSVAELSQQSDYWLEQQGRLTEPVILRTGSQHYEPISWEDAFALIGQELNQLDSPHEAAFYTSGKAVNEAAFALQLFVRQFGTNNLPDCSNMCHEASGAAMRRMLGIGKGSVKLDDFGKADLVFVVGQNPGTNHPRQLAALQESKRAGAKIISVNPLPEAGLMGFMNPQEPLGLLGMATQLTDLYLPVRIGGDVPLFKGIMKFLVEADDRRRGAGIDWAFVEQYTAGIDELLANIRAASWEDIVAGAGLEKSQIEAAAQHVLKSERLIICWCLGVTQHHNGTENVQELLNLLLLRGAMGKPGAGACCVRGHSNVQGDRTMGVWERPNPEFLDRLDRAFKFQSPREHGVDSQRTVLEMHQGKIKVFVSLGGNFLMALSDTQYTAEALQKTRLMVRIGTKLNRADLVTGEQSILLPCLGRTEADVRPGRHGQPEHPQLTSTENSMGVVQSSRGTYAPASPSLLGETEIICRMAHATLGSRSTVDWLAWADDYDQIRDGVAKVIPGFQNFNEDVRRPGGFYLPNPPRERRFTTRSGKAEFTVNPLPRVNVPPGHLVMTTIRSHDQFNTTIYGLHDRYRGLHYERRVVMLNAADIRELGLQPKQNVDVFSHYEGQTRIARSFVVVEYPIPRQCAAMYYPEANILIPIGSTDTVSNCPTFKHTLITLKPAAE